MPNSNENLDSALAALGPLDLEPFAARGILNAAQRQLSQRQRPQTASGLARYEPLCLVTLSILELAWLTLRLS